MFRLSREVAAAVRFEDFDDFGSTTNYKVGANYAISDNFGIRSTYSTGFKAPTPGQANASNTSTELINVNGVPTLVNNGTIPATSPVALSVGGKQLEPEESMNFTAGIYATLGLEEGQHGRVQTHQRSKRTSHFVCLILRSINCCCCTSATFEPRYTLLKLPFL